MVNTNRRDVIKAIGATSAISTAGCLGVLSPDDADEIEGEESVLFNEEIAPESTLTRDHELKDGDVVRYEPQEIPWETRTGEPGRLHVSIEEPAGLIDSAHYSVEEDSDDYQIEDDFIVHIEDTYRYRTYATNYGWGYAQLRAVLIR